MDKYLSDLKQIIKRPEMKVLPGNLAFFFFLSVIPIITLIGYLTTIFSVGTDSTAFLIMELLPSSIAEVLEPFLNKVGMDVNIVIFMISGFILASNGPNSIIVISNTLYDIPQSNYLVRRIKAFFLTILMVVLILFMIIALAFGDSIMKFILSLEFLRQVSKTVYTIYSLLKWPLGLFFVFFVIKFLYTVAPDRRIPSKYVNKGAVFTTIGWSLITAFYSYYVTNFTNYDLFYGSLSNIIVLLMWGYFLAYILVLGIAINTTPTMLEEISTNKNVEINP